MTVKLHDGVWWIRFHGLPGWLINAYLVDDPDGLTLVDSGLPWNARHIRRGVEDAGFSVSDIDRVLITHYDLDHFGGVTRLDELDAPIYAGTPDAGYLTGESKPPLLHHKGAFHRALSWVTSDLDAEPLEDGDSVGGFTAYHTPGHNPGHMAYVNTELDVALLGDLVWEDDGSLTPPVWADSYDMDALHDSICDLSARAPEFETACMGHGEPVTRGSDELVALADAL